MNKTNKSKPSNKAKITRGMLTDLNRKLKKSQGYKDSKDSNITVKSDGKTYRFRELG